MKPVIDLPRTRVLSQHYTVTAEDSKTIDLSFLEGWRGWDIVEMGIHVTPSFAASGGANLDKQDVHRIVHKASLLDIQGTRYKPLRGPTLKAIAQLLLSPGYKLPADGGVDATVTKPFRIPIPFATWIGTKDGRDTRLPVEALVGAGGPGCGEKAGQLDLFYALSTDLATDVTIGSGTTKFRVYAEVVRRRNAFAEAPVRLVWREHPIDSTDDRYEVGGSLFAAFLYAPGFAGEASGDNDWSAVSKLSSETFGFTNLEKEYLIDAFQRDRDLVDPAEDVFAADQDLAIPLHWPARGDLLGHMPPVGKVHLELDAGAPTNARIVFGYLEDAGATFDEAVTGKKATELEGAFHERIATRDGRRAGVKQLPAAKRKRIPRRFVPRSKGS